jgi:hypothetical protein
MPEAVTVCCNVPRRTATVCGVAAAVGRLVPFEPPRKKPNQMPTATTTAAGMRIHG